jgi:hypothetical protein
MKNKRPSLDETFVPDPNEFRLTPYERLQAILNENEDRVLTDTASDKIDFLLGIESKQSYFDKLASKVKDFFKYIDGLIFRKKTRIMNTKFYSRKKK